MKIRRKDTEIISEVTFNQWKGFKNKTAYSVLDWGELLMVREFKPYGERKELFLMDKDHGMNMVKQSPRLYDFRKANQDDLTKLSLKHIILETYQSDLTFEEFFRKKFGSKSTKEFTKMLLKELHKEGEIQSLPIDFDSKDSTLRSSPRKAYIKTKIIKDKPIIKKRGEVMKSRILNWLIRNKEIFTFIIMICAIIGAFRGCEL